MAVERADTTNRLLGLMLPHDFEVLAPHLEPIELPKRFILSEADRPIDFVYFPGAGLGSIVVSSSGGQETEAGLFGFEGVGPVSTLLSADVSPHRILMQIGGVGHRIAPDTLKRAIDGSQTLRDLLLRFIQTMLSQTSYTLFSNAVHPIDERLARWLLMCHDRQASNEIPLTHEFLALMLAVRRPSVTTSLHVLEGNGLIRAERGNITIRNRPALEAFAGDAYGRPEAEYRRLIGPMH